MNEPEQRMLARRLAEDPEGFDFDTALEVVKFDPAEAEQLIREREEMQRRQEERARASERRKLAIREEFG